MSRDTLLHSTTPRRRRSALLVSALMLSTVLTGCSSPEQRMEKFTESGQAYFEQGD